MPEPARRYKAQVAKTKSSPVRPKDAPAPSEGEGLSSAHAKAKILTEALPFMQRYDGETVVVKYGGHAMGDAELAAGFARDIVLIKQVGMNPVVVHGGGPQIGSMLERLKSDRTSSAACASPTRRPSRWSRWCSPARSTRRSSAPSTPRAARRVGISGKDGNLMRARRLERRWRDPGSDIEKVLDLGFVGEPASRRSADHRLIIQSDLIPVVAPIGVGPNGETYNINADTVAGALAAAMKAKRLLLLTDVDGRARQERQR